MKASAVLKKLLKDDACIIMYVALNFMNCPSLAGYVDSLLEEAIRLCSSEDIHHSSSEIPPSLCSMYERPAKVEAIKEHRTRFSSQ